MAFIVFKDVVKKFNGVAVLDGVNLKIEKGDLVCIVGHSGTGKSVTLKHIVRLLSPTSGSVFVDGV
ncbi:MAG: ATP-binding cassette domain-containing protein, partial [Kiritimatiellae bacterium]|nr:ATP-binding cassette domain-containing protein [Kiritimatiellia bacterium]